MSLKIGNYLFTGPFDVTTTEVRKNKPAAVFAIISRGGEPWNPTFTVLAFGESGDGGLVFADHPDKRKWDEMNNGELSVFLLSEDEMEMQGSQARQAIVEELRNIYPEGSGDIPISGGQ